jgi:hypothetical protein
MPQGNMVMSWKAVIPVLGSVSRHSRLVNHVNNEWALQDTDFCGDPECGCWCDGTSMDVHEQASQNDCKSNVFVRHSEVTLLP